MKHIAPQSEMSFMPLVQRVQHAAIPGRTKAHIQFLGKPNPVCGWSPHLRTYWKKHHMVINPQGWVICKTCQKIAAKRGLI